jgi:tetratricopeptide (TPR) repeat protein
MTISLTQFFNAKACAARFSAVARDVCTQRRARAGIRTVSAAIAFALLVPGFAASAGRGNAQSAAQATGKAAPSSSGQASGGTGAPNTGNGGVSASGNSSGLKARVEPGTPATDSLTPLIAQAQQALDKQDFNAAIPLLQKIEMERPDEPLPHFELGYAYSELKRNDDAIKEYRRSLELDPTLAAAHLNLGLVLMDSDPTAALESFHRAEVLLPDQGQPHYLAGRALERANKMPDAIEEYQSAVKLSPRDVPMRFALARALAATGHADDAEAQFRETLALPGDTSPAQLGYAELLVQEKNLAEAADAFAAYLAMKPEDHDARFARAVTLENLNRLDDALAELDRLGKGAPPTANELKLRGSIFLQQKKWTEATAVLRKATEAAPQDAETLGWLGRALIELRNYPDAAATLRRSLAIDPMQIAVMRSLAEANYLSGQYAATLLALDQVGQRDTLRPMDHFIRAICHEKLGQKAEALAAYQQFLSVDHNGNPDQEWQAQQRVKVLLHDLHGG